MDSPKKAQDKLNMVGVVVVGICGAVLVYVSIVLLEAFYMDDTSEVNTMADYGGQDNDVKSLKGAQQSNIGTWARGPAPTGAAAQTFHIPIDVAMAKVAEDAKADPSNLVPAVGRSEKTSIKPVFGRPQLGAAAGSGSGSAAGSGSGTAAAPAAGSGSGTAAAPAAGSGSGTAAAPAAGSGSDTSGAPLAGAAAAPAAAGSGAASAAGSGSGSGSAAHAPGANGP